MPIDWGVKVKINERSVAIAVITANEIGCSGLKIDAANKKIKNNKKNCIKKNGINFIKKKFKFFVLFW